MECITLFSNNFLHILKLQRTEKKVKVTKLRIISTCRKASQGFKVLPLFSKNIEFISTQVMNYHSEFYMYHMENYFLNVDLMAQLRVRQY